MGNQMDIIGILDIEDNSSTYKLIDFLNKNLKDRHLVFGLSKKDETTMRVTIYQV
jgi:hypothetical protein